MLREVTAPWGQAGDADKNRRQHEERRAARQIYLHVPFTDARSSYSQILWTIGIVTPHEVIRDDGADFNRYSLLLFSQRYMNAVG